MALHFTLEEFAERRQKTVEKMIEKELDGLLIFRTGEHVLSDRL